MCSRKRARATPTPIASIRPEFEQPMTKGAHTETHIHTDNNVYVCVRCCNFGQTYAWSGAEDGALLNCVCTPDDRLHTAHGVVEFYNTHRRALLEIHSESSARIHPNSAHVRREL